jgi:hypothetical protein
MPCEAVSVDSVPLVLKLTLEQMLEIREEIDARCRVTGRWIKRCWCGDAGEFWIWPTEEDYKALFSMLNRY